MAIKSASQTSLLDQITDNFIFEVFPKKVLTLTKTVPTFEQDNNKIEHKDNPQTRKPETIKNVIS